MTLAMAWGTGKWQLPTAEESIRRLSSCTCGLLWENRGGNIFTVFIVYIHPACSQSGGRDEDID